MTAMLLAAQRGAVPADEATVRSTTAIVSDDIPAAEMPDAPDYNENESDPNPYLGMTSRNLASFVIPSEQYRSPVLDDASDVHESFDIINRQVSSSGTAAGREDAGEWGHGTMKAVIGIEPTIRPGTEFTDTFFTGHPVVSQNGVSRYMSPSATADPATESQAQATSTDGSRRAVNASQFQAFYDAAVGN